VCRHVNTVHAHWPSFTELHARQTKVREAMAKKGTRVLIRMQSTESGHFYLTEKSRRNDPQRLELKRYDPFLRKHVVYRETR